MLTIGSCASGRTGAHPRSRLPVSGGSRVPCSEGAMNGAIGHSFQVWKAGFLRRYGAMSRVKQRQRPCYRSAVIGSLASDRHQLPPTLYLRTSRGNTELPMADAPRTGDQEFCSMTGGGGDGHYGSHVCGVTRAPTCSPIDKGPTTLAVSTVECNGVRTDRHWHGLPPLCGAFPGGRCRQPFSDYVFSPTSGVETHRHHGRRSRLSPLHLDHGTSYGCRRTHTGCPVCVSDDG